MLKEVEVPPPLLGAVVDRAVRLSATRAGKVRAVAVGDLQVQALVLDRARARPDRAPS